MSNPFKHTTPLTKQMLELLMDCHERELMHMPPYDVGIITRSRGLIKRKLLTTGFFKRDDGKNLMRLYHTVRS